MSPQFLRSLALACLVAGCGGGGEVAPVVAPDAAAADAVAADGRLPAPPPGVVPASPDAAPATTAPPPPPSCAEETVTATREPLDLVMLLDRSDSMLGLKWDLARKAMTAFVKDPRSAGIGVGLQVFPATAGPAATNDCRDDADCGYPAGRNLFCLPRRSCVDGNGAVSGSPCSAQFFGPYPLCTQGRTCQEVGACAGSGAACALGRPCPGGEACNAAPKGCISRIETGPDACSAASYDKLVVPVAPLPGAEPALSGALAGLSPGGGTPMQPAVASTLAALQARAGGKRALVLVTDGAPTPCGPGDQVAAIAQEIERARAMSIPTYVIAVFSGRDAAMGLPAALRFAMAGGTMLFSLEPDVTLDRTFVDSLNAIRDDQLPCAYDIPPPRAGAIDYGKVNVRYQGNDIPYVARAAACDPARGGWYYDDEAQPHRVLVCEATCKAVKNDPMGQVDLVFGCKTRVIE